MRYFVKVSGPGITARFGSDVWQIEGPAAVKAVDGILTIQTINGRHVAYAKGMWARTVIEER